MCNNPPFPSSHLRSPCYLPGIILVLLAAQLLSGCSHKREKLIVGYMPIAECAPLYVAKENGYFEQEGIDIEMLSYPGGKVILDNILTSTLDVGFSNVVSLILMRSQDARFVSVCGASYETRSHQNHALILNSRRWRNNPKLSLEDAKIAVNTRHNVEELFVDRYLAKIGMDKKEIDGKEKDKVETPFPQMLPLLEAGTVDAVSIVEPFITIAREDKTGKFMLLDNHYLSVSDTTLVATYVSTEDIIKTRNAAVRKFVDAIERATKFIGENELQSRGIIDKYVKMPSGLVNRIGLPSFAGSINPYYLQQLIDAMNQAGLLKKRVPTVEELIKK